MNSLAQKITLGIAGIASIVGIIMLIVILITGNEPIKKGEAEFLKDSFIYLVIAMLVIAVLYFVITGVFSLMKNPSALKKDALPLIVLVVIGILLIWVSSLDTNVLAKASFINEENARLTEYYGLSSDQLGSILSWRTWLTVTLGITGILLLAASVAFVYDMIKSSLK
ncbi:MAG: hypothetical protein ACK5MD_04455 [Flavobacteriales bacterium]